MVQHTVPIQVRLIDGNILRIQAKGSQGNRNYGFGGSFSLEHSNLKFVSFRDWLKVQTHTLASLTITPAFDDNGLAKVDNEGNTIFVPATSKYVPGEAYVIKGPSGHVIVRIFGAKFNRPYGAAVRLRRPGALKQFIKDNKE